MIFPEDKKIDLKEPEMTGMLEQLQELPVIGMTETLKVLTERQKNWLVCFSMEKILLSQEGWQEI